MENKAYIFTSARLGFRGWRETDIDMMAEINADTQVMEFFPNIPTREDTKSFIARMQQQLAEKDLCYFAVNKLENKEFIGFIGLSEQTFDADFTPCIDIGWRLRANEWNKGYATEGAKRCLGYAFEELQLGKVYAIAPKVNLKSELVMNKIGMHKVKNFKHPKLVSHERLEECVLYEILNDNKRFD